MLEATALRFVIRRQDGAARELTVDSDNARIGSGAHCEIKLPAEDAAVEQLRIEARSGGVFGEARCLEPPVLLNGAPFVQGRLLPDSVLRIGAVELSVDVVARNVDAEAQSRQSRAGRRLIYALGAVGIPLGIFLVAAQPRAEPGFASQPPQPLWSKEEPVSCPQRDAASARVLADKQQQQAEAARERAPFSPQDGVQAVELFSRAAACYSSAGAGPEARRAQGAAADLKQVLARDFHVHQVRLERALVTGRYDQASTEIGILLAFGARRSDAYFSWLSTLDRQLELKFLGRKQ